MRASLRGFIGLVSIGVLILPAMGQSGDVSSEISRALSAAPPSIAAGAEVVSTDDRGHMKLLRPGINGWTCMTGNETTAQHDETEDSGACFDKYGLEWIKDYMAGRAPNPEHVGYSYMLKGGFSWSNTDPSATKLAPGQKSPIRIPPHIMILNARLANSSGFPSGQANPDTSKPFVMFGGTPFALLIIPVK